MALKPFTPAPQTIKSITDNLGKYVVRPANAFGLAGFVFDIADEVTVTLSADITDHFAEDNAAIQDHIAIKPKRVVLSQYVGEVVHRRDGSTNTILQQTVRKLTALLPYLPKLTEGARQAKATYEKLSLDNYGIKNAFKTGGDLSALDSIGVSNVADIWAAVKNLTPPPARQQQAYMFFKALLEQKILVSLETPFEFMTNMAIESVVPRQGGETDGISEFTVTLKEMRFAATRTVAFDRDKYRSPTNDQSISRVGDGKDLNSASPAPPQGRAGVQAAPTLGKGVVPGKQPLADQLASEVKKIGLPGLALPAVKGITDLPPL